VPPDVRDFKAKMHQIRFPLGLRPRPRWRRLRHFTDPYLYLRGVHLSEGREERGEMEREGKVKARERESRWSEGFGPIKILAWRPYARPIADFKGASRRVG